MISEENKDNLLSLSGLDLYHSNLNEIILGTGYKDEDGKRITIKAYIDKLKSNFQDGVDGIYNAIVAEGTTPDGKSLSEIKEGLADMSAHRYLEGQQNASQGNANKSDVLAGKTFTSSNGLNITGTMVNNGDVSRSIDPGEGLYLESGYYNSISIEPTTDPPILALVTPSTEAQVIKRDRTVYSEIRVAAIPDKYKDTSDATATENDILADKTAYVNGQKITGAIQSIEADDITLSAGQSYKIPKGYHSGNATISVSGDIVEGGIDTTITENAATPDDIRLNKKAFVNGTLITGTRADYDGSYSIT